MTDHAVTERTDTDQTGSAPIDAEQTDTDVVVIGLGPTGLTMAHALAARGLDVVALEREPTYYGMARAVYTDDECLRIMQNLGLADELHADMIHDLRVRWLKPDGAELGWFLDPSRKNGWPTANFLYQPAFEQTLERALSRFAERTEGHGADGHRTDGYGSVTIRRGRAVAEVTQDERRAVVAHDECTGAGYGRGDAGLVPGTRETLTAQYVIACDGGRSVVRRQLGIEMTGKRFPQRWLVVDLLAHEGETPFAHLQTFDFVCDPVLPTVSCPQPNGRHRFEFMLHDDDVTEDFEKPQKAIDLIAPYCEPGTYDVTRQLVYTFNALVAERWRDGRIFLAGDAAHMTPQFVGQGMNAGLRDADNLAWKIADVLRHGASDALLDTYESERRPHASAMIALSVFNKDVVSTAKPALIRLRDVGIGLAVKTPGAKRLVTEAKVKPRPRFRRGRFFGAARGPLGAEGTLMPQPRVRDVAGVRVRFDDVVGHGWLAVGLGVDPRAVAPSLTETDLPFTWVALDLPHALSGSRARHAQRASTVPPVGALGDPAVGHRVNDDEATHDDLIRLTSDDDGWRRWCGHARYGDGSVLVIRPDKFVFGVACDDADAASLARLLRAAAPSPSFTLPKGRLTWR